MNDDPLAQLHDIQLPADPGWWPLAPGWWVLAALLIVAIAWLVLRRWRRWQREAWRRAALAELDSICAAASPTHVARDLNRLLRRVAREAIDPQAAALSGQQWTDFLREHAPATLPGALWDSLACAPYRPAAAANIDAWQHGCRRWITSLPQA